MCGIFGYLNYLIERDRRFIFDTLTQGLSRLEYRGYDSAGKLCCSGLGLLQVGKKLTWFGDLHFIIKGVAVDADAEDDTMIVKQVGKVAALRKLIDEQKCDFNKTFISHCSMVRN